MKSALICGPAHTSFGEWDGERERVFLVRAERFTPSPALSVEQLRSEYLVDLRWWSTEELLNEPDTTFFAPLHLPQLVHDVVSNLSLIHI